MKKIGLLVLVISTIFSYSSRAQFERRVKPVIYRYGKPKGFAIVELYTSEGCSSCPKAENVMSLLQEFYRERLFILQFHVDYWNREGWTDSFSDASYSARQKSYMKLFGGGQEYTPQAIVNGKAQATGSDKLMLRKLIEGELEHEPDSTLAITVKRNGDKAVSVHYQAGLAKGEVLNIALVQTWAMTQVTGGENAGRQLEHESIVRHFQTVQDNSGNITITLPPGVTASQCRVMAFVQKRSNMQVTAVTDSSIPE